MANIPISLKYGILDYSTFTKSKVLLSGEQAFFTSVITGQVSQVHVMGNGSLAVSALPFIERLEIIAAANVDLEDLRITGNKVKIFNSTSSDITVQTGITGSLTYENVNPYQTVKAFFDGTYWRLEDPTPLLTIQAWHPDFNGASLAVPWGWKKKDGTAISDPESPYNGATLDDLIGDGRFLRAGATSGVEQGFAMEDHYHAESFTRGSTAGSTFNLARGGTTDVGSITTGDVSPSDAGGGAPAVSTETRPINMSVVMIMKIK